MQLSVKRKEKQWVKNYIYMSRKCSPFLCTSVTCVTSVRLVTQHLSSSLCLSSGTEELARQTMLLREEKRREEKRGKKKRREEKRRREENKSASGGRSSRRRRGCCFSYLIPETEL